MSEYGTFDTETGEYIHVYDLDACLKAIHMRNKKNEDKIKLLEEENKKLKDKHYKNNEIQRIQHELNKMQKDYYRGFPISEKEEKNIKDWERKHDERVHGLITNKLKMKAQGVSGGRYSYHFVPTALGTSGVVRCSCGAEYIFQEIG